MMSQELSTGFRLSPQQKRLWLSARRGGAYVAQCVLHVEGVLRPELLRAAAGALVARHEVLRTTFEYVPGFKTPLQVVQDDAAPCWRAAALRAQTETERRAEVEGHARADARVPFDFERGPLVRFSLLAASPEEHALVVTLPSLCADARTLKNLSAELARAYAAALEGVEAFDEPVPYVQFSEWQNELLEGEEGEDGREHWRRHALGGLDAPSLPLEGEAPDESAFEVARHARPIDAPLASGLERAAAAEGVAVSDWLLACWQTLLWRLTGQAEAAVAVRCEGRVFEQLQEAFGLYARWPPVRCRLAADFRFAEVLRHAREAAQEAAEWQEYFSRETLAEAAGEGAWESPVAFEYEEWAEPQQAGGLKLVTLDSYAHTERFKLKLSCARRARELELELHYDAARYAPESVALLAARFEALLAQTVEDAQARVASFDVLGGEERTRLLGEWNDTHADFDSGKCLHELFEEQAARTPHTLALVADDAQLTYGELNARANRLAHHLRSLGVGPESLVAVCVERSTRMVVAVLGILKAGGAYVPLDPQHPSERLLFMLEEAGAAVLLTERGRREELSGRGAWRPVCLDDDWEQSPGEGGENLPRLARPDNLAYVIYTSGSTGRPKGVMITHRSAVNLVAALDGAIYEGQAAPLRVSLNAPLAFDSSVKQLLQLLRGHTLVIVPEEVRPDGSALWQFVRRQRIDVLDCTPSQLRLLLSAGWEDAREEWAPALALVGGEAIDEATWRRLTAISRTRFYNVYGPTECTVDATACLVGAQSQGPSLGRPLANMRVYVLDEALRPAPVGVAGELHVGGEGVGRGYRRQPALTAEKFIPDPFSPTPGARLYRTGDVARVLPGGLIEYLGRVDHQVKVRGHRIELGEIEATLRGREGVGQAVVVVREDAEDDRRLVAYLVGSREAAGGEGELRAFVRERLPEYMLPAAFVWLAELPLTPNGKVDRRALPAPEQQSREVEAGYVAPRTQTEELLAGVWAEVLRIERVGVTDSFFDLGGHSLLATQLVSRLRELLRAEVPLRLVFERPTVAGFAEYVKRGGAGAASPPPAIVPAGAGAIGPRIFPLSFAQRRLWFLQQFDPGNTAYNVSNAARLVGRLNVRALERTLAEIIRRHEVLRTTFEVNAGGEPVQVVNPPYPVTLPVVDLEELGAGEREAQVRRLASEYASHPFDLSRGPLLRGALLRLRADEHVLLFILHHIVSDDWSKGVLVREVSALYEAYSEGRESPLAEPPVQYADFAQWQRAWLTGGVLEEQMNYWRGHLSGSRELALPLDRPRPPAQTYRGARMPIVFPRELTAGLAALGCREGATLFMTLLAAFKTLLHRYSRQDDILIGTPIANRNRAEIEGLIGFFANTLVMRTDLSGNPTFLELLGRVREVTLGAYAHQDVPFEMIVKELQPERDLNRTPLFQVVLTLNSPMPPLELPRLTLTPMRVEEATSKFDIVLSLVDARGTLPGWFEYNTDLFDARTIRRMWGHFERLLASVIARPGARLSELQILPEEEQSLLEKSVVVDDLEGGFSF
ncbi:MAG: amino acid adenylation domain-containing protein [Acidobacteria bacterium]|nr:amino acid adenylation domain-containing protein [Acidobacteriota bacterium]